jgi:hypothetical protein
VQAEPLVVIKSFASNLKKGVTLLLNAARLDSASVNLPHGVAPDSDHIVNGDLWTTTAGIYVRINGHTVGPLIDAGSLRPMTMTVTASSPPTALCFVLDVTQYSSHPVAWMKAGVIDALSLISAIYGPGLDLAVVAYDHAVSSIIKRSASAGDVADVITWIGGLSEDTNFQFDGEAALIEAKSFFDGTDASIVSRHIVMVWGGVVDKTATSDTGVLTGYANDARAVLDSMSGVLLYSIDVQGVFGTDYTSILDNTPDDGLPVALTSSAITAAIQTATVGALAVTTGPGHLQSASGSAIVVGADAQTADPTALNYRPCNCWVSASAEFGADVVVYMPGQFVPQSGLAPGATYWLAASGGITTTAPSTGGNLDQVLGWADETGDRLFFAPQRGAGAV